MTRFTSKAMTTRKIRFTIIVFIFLSLIPIYFDVINNYKRLVRPTIGLELGFPFGEDEPPEVIFLDAHGPAKEAGIQINDVVLKIHGKNIRSQAEVESMMSSLMHDEKLFVVVDRNAENWEFTVEVRNVRLSSKTLYTTISHYIIVLGYWLISVLALVYSRLKQDKILFSVFAYCICCVFSWSTEVLATVKEIVNNQFEWQLKDFVKFTIWWMFIFLSGSTFLHLLLVFPRSLLQIKKSKIPRTYKFFVFFERHIWLVYGSLLSLLIVLWLWRLLFFHLIGSILPLGYVFRALIALPAFFILLAILKFFLSYRADEDPEHRKQERILLIGIIVSALGFSVYFCVMFVRISLIPFETILWMSNFNVYFINFFALVFLATLWASLFRFKLDELDPLVNKTIIHLITLTICIIAFTIIEHVSALTLSRYVHAPNEIISIVCIIVIALGFTPIRVKTEHMIKNKL